MPASLRLPQGWPSLCTPQDLAVLANWTLREIQAVGVNPPQAWALTQSRALCSSQGRSLSALVEVGGLIDGGLCRKRCWDFPLEPESLLLWLFRRSEGRAGKILTKQPATSVVGLQELVQSGAEGAAVCKVSWCTPEPMSHPHPRLAAGTSCGLSLTSCCQGGLEDAESFLASSRSVLSSHPQGREQD